MSFITAISRPAAPTAAEPPPSELVSCSAIRRAITWELARQNVDGSIDARGSTRVGAERARSGKIKEVNYAEILQALVFASQALGEPSWRIAARKIAELRHW